MSANEWEEVLRREDEVEIRTLMQALPPAALKEFTVLFLQHIQEKAKTEGGHFMHLGGQARSAEVLYTGRRLPKT